MRPSRFVRLVGAVLLALQGVGAQTPRPGPAQPQAGPYTTWSDYGGGADASQYSALSQINRSNVSTLQIAWTYPTGDAGNYLFNPVVVDDVMYVLAKNNSIVALNAATGKEIWVHENPRGRITTHGINYWESKDRSERRLLFSINSLLQAIDARTGASISSFGGKGWVDLREGLGRDPARISVQSISPGRVFEDLIIVGSATNQEYDSAPGDIRAYDVRSGRLVWTFHTIPHAGEFGDDTWPKDAWKTVGGANAWSEMSVDGKRGIVYIPTASPKYNFYGANRKGANLFGDCLLALDARTGKRIWHFQMVHHDIWDWDNATAPKLLTVRHDGRSIDIVAQAGKTGFLYVFDRVTGEPLWPIEERPVPRSQMPGEETWPTQPFPVAPKPFARQTFTEKDLSPFIDDPAERARFLEDIRGARNQGMFTPPGLGNTIEMPGNNGGSNFGGAAVDPEHGTMFVVSKDLPAMLKLVPPPAAPSAAPNSSDPAAIQYKSGFGFMITSSGLSAIAPPWTTLTAYDLNSGTITWQIPLGEVPELAAKGVSNTGAHFPKVGPVVTAGGLIFTGTRDRAIRALDVNSGKVLWKAEVDAGVEGIPAVYEVGGKQYLVYCAAARATTHTHAVPGHPASNAPIPGAYVAFTLPNNPTTGQGSGRGAAAPAQVPPLGTGVSAEEKATLQARVDRLSATIAALKKKYASGPMADRIADVDVYLDAVRRPLKYDERLYAGRGSTPVAVALQTLATGTERAGQLTDGQAPWMTQSGVRGFYSRIDGSAQPYILTMPDNYDAAAKRPYRLDVFMHGRDDAVLEQQFMTKSTTGYTSKPLGAGADRFMLQPYGRYTNASRFAGEIDGFEAIESVAKAYPIDRNRIVMTGFSMGGASVWSYTVHFADRWAATAPGAGFSETQVFLRGDLARQPQNAVQKTLWHMYDATDYAVNTFNVPVVAYSGANDGQKQAADAMAAAMLDEGLTLEHVIGPNTGHSYEPGARQQLQDRVDRLAARGRDPVPKEIRFTTWMLRYNKMFWVTIDAMSHQWERARVGAKIDGDTIRATTVGVEAMHLAFDPGLAPFAAGARPTLNIDGAAVTLPAVARDKSLGAGLVRTDGVWRVGDLPAGGLRKVHGLQGPIDDAFMDAFVFVRPTGTPFSESMGKWEREQADYAISEWVHFFRGEPRVKNDTDISAADIASSNIALFGDPSSNAVYKRIADRLPIRWRADGVVAGAEKFPANHAPVFIFPNPLNPKKYVVVNSGFTFHDQSNNDMQSPKLPDWAVVDITRPGNNYRYLPVFVESQGFFDEAWRLKAPVVISTPAIAAQPQTPRAGVETPGSASRR